MLGISIVDFGKCKKYGNQVSFLSLKKGLCSQCRVANYQKNIDNFLSEQPFIFKDNKSAFEYACKFKDCTIYEGAHIPALVIDSDKDNEKVALKVASDDGGFLTLARPITKEHNIQNGDFVAWTAVKYTKGLVSLANEKGLALDPRIGWFGVISGILTPRLTNKGWTSEVLWIDPNKPLPSL